MEFYYNSFTLRKTAVNAVYISVLYFFFFMLHSQAEVPLGCQQLLMGFADSWCGWWREVGLMMVIMPALSWAAVFICWLQFHIACSVSGSARFDAEWLWFIGFPCSLASVRSSRHLIRREVWIFAPSFHIRPSGWTLPAFVFLEGYIQKTWPNSCFYHPP